MLLVVILQDANLKTKSDKCNSFLADYIPNLTTAAIYHVDPLLLTSTGCHFKICTSLIIVEFNLVANKNSDEMFYLDGATGNYWRRAVWYCRDVNPALMCSRNVLLFCETFSNKPVLLRRIIGLSMNGWRKADRRTMYHSLMHAQMLECNCLQLDLRPPPLSMGTIGPTRCLLDKACPITCRWRRLYVTD